MFGKRTLALLVALSAVYSAQAIEICHVEPRRMGAGDFNRLAHFFGKTSENPTRVVAYNDAENKTGTYWATRFDTKIKKLPEGAKVKLELILAGEKENRVFEYAIPATKKGSKTLYLGVSDKTFPEGIFPRILAWRVELQSKAGEKLAESKSLLWEW